jgi:hypothetical protein
MDILEEDNIPLIRCELSPEGHITPHFIKAERKVKYTAVSHVCPVSFPQTQQ